MSTRCLLNRVAALPVVLPPIEKDSLLPISMSNYTAAIVVAVALASTAVMAQDTQPSIAWNAETGQAVLTNGQLELVIETKAGINPRSLRDVKTGQVYADRDYAWSLNGVVGFPRTDIAPVVAMNRTARSQ